MRIRTISVPVLDQEVAFKFYTEILGFQVKHDIPLGGGNRWLTVVSAEEPDGPEVLLEPAPLHFEPARIYQKALFDAGFPYTQFDVEDLEAEFERLKKKGVQFVKNPTDVGTAIIAIFHDTCGNNIQLLQMK